MPHTHVSNRLHCIFSTNNREKLIPRPIQGRLWAYMDGIARDIGVKTFAIGGTDDHVHLLIGLPATLTLATAMQKIKANSSRYMNEHGGPHFRWQENYSAFSVSISHMDATVAYIQNQEKHHRRRSFDEELAATLSSIDERIALSSLQDLGLLRTRSRRLRGGLRRYRPSGCLSQSARFHLRNRTHPESQEKH